MMLPTVIDRALRRLFKSLEKTRREGRAEEERCMYQSIMILIR